MNQAAADRPPWAQQLMDHFLAGGSSFFILHGNVDDAVGSTAAQRYQLDTLTDCLGLHLLATSRWESELARCPKPSSARRCASS